MTSKGKSGGGSSSSSADEDREVVQVCKWDGTGVKNALDDGVKEVLITKFPYVEDHTLMDIRIVICTIAVAVASFALAWDYFYPFPASRQVLIACVGSYFFLMSILTLYTTYKEKGIFAVFRDKDPSGLDPDSKWELSSHMKKFDDMYQLDLTFYNGRTTKVAEDSFNRSVGDFFDEDGLLCMDLLEQAVLKLHKNLLATDKKTN